MPERILALVETAEADFEALRGRGGRPAVDRGLPDGRARHLPRGAEAPSTSSIPTSACCSGSVSPSASSAEVSRGEIDLAVVQDWLNRPMAIPDGLSRHALLDDVADIAVPADHPLLPTGSEISLSELPDDRWITLGAGHGLPRLPAVPGAVGGQGEPDIVCMADEYPTQLALVAGGHGHRADPARCGRGGRVPEGVRAIPILPRPTRRIYALWRTDAARRPAIRAAVDALRDGLRPTGDHASARLTSSRHVVRVGWRHHD